VVEAISQRPWLHAEGTSFDKKTAVEFWFSARDGIIVQRQNQQVWFFDLREQLWDSYQPSSSGKQAIYRTPLTAENRGGVAAVQEVFAAMLSGDLRNAFTNGGQQEVELTQRDVSVDGASLREFTIKVPSPAGTLAESNFRVDPKTQLPTSWTFAWPIAADGAKDGWHCAIDYPESGPKTIYGAGIPADTPLVGRIPQDAQRLLHSASLARQRGDSYYAVVVSSLNPDPRHPEAPSCRRIWRKGTKWRVDFCRSPQNGKPLPAGVDPSAWWKQHLEQVRSFPESIFDGARECTYTPVMTDPPRVDPSDPNWLEIASFQRSYRKLNADPWPNNNLPEFFARPPIDVGLSGDRLTVDWSPSDGPAGSVRVESNLVNATPGQFSGRRYWIDPRKDHLVVLSAQLKLGADGKQEQLDPVAEVLEVCTSPSGRIYPTLVRMHNGSVSMGTEKKSDYYHRFFYDFSAPIADEQFDASK
jgi:hypothetical protein